MKKNVIANRSVWMILMLLTFVISSCEKGEKELTFDGDFGLKVNMLGLEINGIQSGQPSLQSSSFKKTVSTAINAQQKIIPFGKNLNLRATLKPEIDSAAVMQSFKSKIAAANQAGVMAADSRVAAGNELAENTAYRVMVYNTAGTLVGSRVYQYKALNLEDDDLNTGYENLVVGETYTFVVYSINTTEQAALSGTIQNENDLAEASINSDSQTDLLYFKEDVKIELGVNYLNVRLKHQFSQVTAVIKVDESTPELLGTRIYGINQSQVLPSFNSGSVKFSDGSFTVSGQNTEGLNLVFPTIADAGLSTVRSEPLRVISNGSDATFNVGALTINDITKSLSLTHFGSGASQEAFTIQPGVRYTLELEIAAPCTQVVDGSEALVIPPYSSGESRSGEFDFIGADYSGEVDIYKIDNSFNMTINGQPLYIGSQAISSTSPQTPTNEIQLQGFGAYARPEFPNIEFADGTRWGETGASWTGSDHEIWNFNGVANKQPIIRIRIDNDGVTIYGSKNLDGGEPFYPLKLINEEPVYASDQGTRYIRGRFNEDLKWSQDGINKIVVSQYVDGATEFNGFVRGTQRIPCN